jgi:lipid-A-disaccharide synthase
MLARDKPAVVLYRIKPITWATFRLFVWIKSITLPNLIARRKLLPEWCVVFRPKRDSRAMSSVVIDWLDHPFKLAAAARDLRQLRLEIVEPGASGRTADRILGRLAPFGASKAA